MSDGSVEAGVPGSEVPLDYESDDAFAHAAGFARTEAGGLTLGPLETQYEELFAEVLEDGVITSEERARLEKAADNLGLDRQRLLRLEQAMVASYETRNRVRVIERFEEPTASLAPIQIAEAGDTGRELLEKRIASLEARIKELEEELRVARANVNVEVDLGDLDAAAEQATEDPEEWLRRARRDPVQPEPYRKLFRIFDARGEADRRWCSAQALVVLGAANDAEQAVYEAGRPKGLIAPRASLSASSWYDQLFHPDEEVLTGQIFGVIAPAVLIGRVTTLRRDRKLHQPDPGARQEIEKTTLTSVRALGWAAAILGLAAPPVYVEKTRPSAFEHIPGVPPMTVVGARALSGRSQLELAFLAGRHLCWYRQEHFVRTLFSSIVDLEDLFLAALIIGSPRLPVAADVRQRVTPIARAIEPLLETPHLDALRGHFLRFVEEGGRTNLQRWSSGAEKTACRAGLLLSSDLATAVALLETEEGRLGELAKDLLVFSVGERHSQLRRQLGIALSS